MLTVVLDTISAFFSSPFSENSTSLQVSSPSSPQSSMASLMTLPWGTALFT